MGDSERTRDGGEGHAKRRSFNDVRAPLMLLYVAVFVGGRIGCLAAWALLAAMAVLVAVVAFLYEGREIGRATRFNLGGAAIGAGAGCALYVLIAFGLRALAVQATSGAQIESGVELPWLFTSLLKLRGCLDPVPAVLAGLGGAFLLAPAEEMFWRGFVQLRISLWLGKWIGPLLASLLYAGLYALALGPLAALGALLTGAVCAGLTARSGSLVPAIVCHAVVWALAIWIMPVL
ncbi:MAG: CPBP family intramembrane glutamic endopeptidase [Polyangia bacterium]